MFTRSLRRCWPLVPLAVAFLLFTTFVWLPQPLIVPADISGFVNNVEGTLPLLLLACFSFLLPDTYEIELGLTCGVSTAKLAFSKAMPLVLYTILSAWVFLLFYQYTPYTSTDFPIVIPIWVPENFKWYLFVSFAVTVLFFAALFLLIRVITRNCYVPIGVGMFFFVVLYAFYKDVHSLSRDIRWCLIDPFISAYFVGNEVPNAYAARYADLAILHNAWTYNRLLFLGLALLLFGASYLLLRREKLHKTFRD